MQLTNKGDPPSVQIDLYNLAELNDLKFKIKKVKIVQAFQNSLEAKLVPENNLEYN